MIYTDGTPTICSQGVRPHVTAQRLLDNDKPTYREAHPHSYKFAIFTDRVRNMRRFGEPDPPVSFYGGRYFHRDLSA